MVLEAAFDSSPTSDSDPYTPKAARSNSGDGVHIDLSKAYRPMPILGPLLGFNNRSLLSMVTDVVREAPRLLRRNLTQDEVDAAVTSASKYQQTHSYIYGFGILQGARRAWQTQAEMRWPSVGPMKMPEINMNKFGPLEGHLARAVWNGFRGTIWVACWGLPAYLVGGLFGSMAAAYIHATDPRLREFLKEIRSDSVKTRVSAEIDRRKAGVMRPARDDTESLDRATPQMRADDMSPQMTSDVGLDTSEDIRRHGLETYTHSSPRETTPRSTSRDSPSDSLPFDRPTTSPTGSTESFDSASGGRSEINGGSAWERVRSQASGSESSWDRIRRGQASSDGQSMGSRSTRQSQNTPASDSFTFDQRDEDQQLAKEEAQRDFDSRIERERQGKDFSESRGRAGGW